MKNKLIVKGQVFAISTQWLIDDYGVNGLCEALDDLHLPSVLENYKASDPEHESDLGRGFYQWLVNTGQVKIVPCAEVVLERDARQVAARVRELGTAPSGLLL